jgi:hypothetical protein
MTATGAAMSDITLSGELASRILREGYGSGAWHGPDLRAAIDDVSTVMAFHRPGTGRHNIAEIVMHHAYCVRSVIERLGGSPGAFPLAGEDWFALNDERKFQWSEVRAVLDALQSHLTVQAAKLSTSASNANERMDLILGITCHAVYHAGQIQLIKALATTRSS